MKVKLAKETPVQQSKAGKALITLKTHVRRQMELKFRNIHAVVKYNRPFSDYEWLNDLDKAKGLDVDVTYTGRKAGTYLLEYAETERETLVELVKKSQFFSLSMDGSTDCATVEQETLFLKTSQNGRHHVKFLCIGMPQSSCSDDLFKFVVNQLKANKVYEHMNKFVGLGSDGASNMIG